MLSHKAPTPLWDSPPHDVKMSKSPILDLGKGGRGRVQGKGEGPRKNWEKVQVLWICRGVGVVTSKVIRNEYRI